VSNTQRLKTVTIFKKNEVVTGYVKSLFLHLPNETKVNYKESIKSGPFQRSEARAFRNQVKSNQRLEGILKLTL
jgi:hypothetical protein